MANTPQQRTCTACNRTLNLADFGINKTGYPYTHCTRCRTTTKAMLFAQVDDLRAELDRIRAQQPGSDSDDDHEDCDDCPHCKLDQAQTQLTQSIAANVKLNEDIRRLRSVNERLVLQLGQLKNDLDEVRNERITISKNERQRLKSQIKAQLRKQFKQAQHHDFVTPPPAYEDVCGDDEKANDPNSIHYLP